LVAKRWVGVVGRNDLIGIVLILAYGSNNGLERGCVVRESWLALYGRAWLRGC
jgi:hypothetical protein